MQHNDVRTNFEQWTATSVFEQRCRTFLDPMDELTFYRENWLRELWLADVFARKIAAEAVRLVPRPATRPDFEVRLRNRAVLRVEATEALLPGRERLRECKEAAAAGYPHVKLTGDEFPARRAAIPLSVEAVVRKKLTKRYSPDTSLLVYVNINTFDWWQPEIERDLIECTRPAATRFENVWALWSSRLYQCWPRTCGPVDRKTD